MAQGTVTNRFTYKGKTYNVDDTAPKMTASEAARYEKLNYIKLPKEESKKVAAKVEAAREAAPNPPATKN